MANSGQDLTEALRDSRLLLINTVEQMRIHGESLAGAEQKYRIELCKKILTERANGQPVTILADICRGDERVAMLKFNRDLNESNYKVDQEKINAIKIEIRILEAEILNERQGC